MGRVSASLRRHSAILDAIQLDTGALGGEIEGVCVVEPRNVMYSIAKSTYSR